MRWPQSDDLLRRLGSGIRPGLTAALRDTNLDSPDFQALLRSAHQGDLRSGRTVSIDHTLGIDLTEDQSEELTRAADAAEAAGAAVLAAIVDHTALLVDIPSRTVADARPLRVDGTNTVPIVTGVDAAVLLTPTPVPDDDDPEPVASDLRTPTAGRIGSDALIRSLGRSLTPATQPGDR